MRSTHRKQSGGAQIWLFGAVALAIAAVSFAFQNGVPVTVNFLFFRFDSSLAMVLLIAFGLGALSAGLMSWGAILKLRWELRRIRRQAAEIPRNSRIADGDDDRFSSQEAVGSTAKPSGLRDPADG